MSTSQITAELAATIAALGGKETEKDDFFFDPPVPCGFGTYSLSGLAWLNGWHAKFDKAAGEPAFWVYSAYHFIERPQANPLPCVCIEVSELTDKASGLVKVSPQWTLRGKTQPAEIMVELTPRREEFRYAVTQDKFLLIPLLEQRMSDGVEEKGRKALKLLRSVTKFCGELAEHSRQAFFPWSEIPELAAACRPLETVSGMLPSNPAPRQKRETSVLAR